MQRVWFGPASATSGRSSTWTLVVEVRTGHTPFRTDHSNVLVPKTKPATDVVADAGEAIIPAPVISDQVPVPDTGALPFNCAVDVLIHTV
jgi:hypothetical protein